jgi:hypothetical protein
MPRIFNQFYSNNLLTTQNHILIDIEQVLRINNKSVDRPQASIHAYNRDI